MNPSYLYPVALYLILLPVSSIAQLSSFSSNPVHPLSLLNSQTDSRPFIQLRYTSPYGIRSLSDCGIRHSQPLFRGYTVSAVNAIGIKGYYQYSLELGYIIHISPAFQAGLILFTDLSANKIPGSYSFNPGSSFYSSINYEDRIICNIYFNSWTDLLLPDKYPGRAAVFSISSKFITITEVNIIAGFLYEKGRMPLLRIGISIIANSSHQIITGIQTGPIGFWMGYKLSTDRMDFIFSMQTSGIFGYEPGSSLKYLLN